MSVYSIGLNGQFYEISADKFKLVYSEPGSF
jgi:hypothetical protein